METLKMTKKQLYGEIKNYIGISLGLVFYSFAWTAILTPAKVMGNGIPGVGMLIYYATGGEAGGIPMGYSYMAINAVLLLLGFIIIGPRFGAKTIYAMAFNSLMLILMQKYIPNDVLGLAASDKFLSAVLGGALCGLGIGICFSQGGSTGGTDIIAMIVNKYRNVSLGKVIMFCDIIIVGCSYFVFKDISTVIYGYVTVGVVGYTIDAYMQGGRQSCQLMIISKQYAPISDRIVVELHRGVTVLEAEGWYTKTRQRVLMVCCRRNEVTAICRIVKEADPEAFISNAPASGIYGAGFENLKSVAKANPGKNKKKPAAGAAVPQETDPVRTA